MGRFQAIVQPADLPTPGLAVESDVLDFKEDVRKGPSGSIELPDLAKDVAAFANASGGTLLIGALEERATGRLLHYAPFDAPAIAKLRKAYSEAVRDFCSPRPICDSTPIAHGSGSVLAVNVWPFPGQVVGARLQQKGERIFRFPLRTGIDTHYLEAEQLPMLMIPELRRLVVLLRGIPRDEYVRRYRSFASPGGEQLSPVTKDCMFVAVDELSNVVMFREGPSYGEEHYDYVPLDKVRSVWRERARWCVVIRD